MQRALNMVRFLWVLCQATVDGLTQWLHTFTKEHRDMSTVLWVERYVLTQKLCQVGVGGGGALQAPGRGALGDAAVPLAGRRGAQRGPGRPVPAGAGRRDGPAGGRRRGLSQQHGFKAGA